MFSFQLDHETEFEKQAREGMNDDESQFSVQMAIEPQAFVWSDKYRPRKPRFFNRVHTVSSTSFKLCVLCVLFLSLFFVPAGGGGWGGGQGVFCCEVIFFLSKFHMHTH